MPPFSTSLLREKFTVNSQKKTEDEAPIIAYSSRMGFTLGAGKKLSENIVIRTKFMHSAVRVLASLLQDYEKNGPILNRYTKENWSKLWDAVQSAHEKSYIKDNWLAVYSGGHPAYVEGKHHNFLDIVERCHAVHKESYEQAIIVAERAFREAGWPAKIEYDSNVALVTNITEDQARIGVILRIGGRNATFNFTAKPGTREKMDTPQCLRIAADYLEGIQLANVCGIGRQHLLQGNLPKFCPEQKVTESGEKRLAELNMQIKSFVSHHSVFFRPEQPDFFELKAEAQAYAARNFEAEEKIDSDA